MKKIVWIVLALCILFSGIVYAVEPSFTLRLDSQNDIYADEDLFVDLSVTDYVYGQHKTSAVAFEVIFDNLSFDYQDFSTIGGKNLNVSVTESVYGDQGRLNLVVTMLGMNNAVNSDTDLLSLRFRPKNVVGPKDFELLSSSAATSEGILFYPSNVSALVSVWNVLDVNKDGKIDLSDAAIASYYAGEPASAYPNCDVNRDGVIDEIDVQLIISGFSY